MNDLVAVDDEKLKAMCNFIVNTVIDENSLCSLFNDSLYCPLKQGVECESRVVQSHYDPIEYEQDCDVCPFYTEELMMRWLTKEKWYEQD